MQVEILSGPEPFGFRVLGHALASLHDERSLLLALSTWLGFRGLGLSRQLSDKSRQGLQTNNGFSVSG